jgi:hypothetical protein
MNARSNVCELCGRHAAPTPRTGKRRYPHKCSHGAWCVRGDRLAGWHANVATCPECKRIGRQGG